MTTFYRGSAPLATQQQTAADLMRRRPLRVTTTINWQLHQRLQQRADEEGRSLSNLIAHLLEVGTV